MNFSVLIVDDEKNIRAGLSHALELDGYDTLLAADGQEALEIIADSEVDLVIADLKMPRVSGQELLRRLVEQYPSVPVIILTGHGTIATAVTAMRDGAYDFLTKPVNLDRLSLLAKRALSTRELALRHRALQEELESRHSDSAIIGTSAAMQRLMRVVRQVAPTKASVLVTGESGVGKELVADALHRFSDRSGRPLVKVHCAALAETLLESELFGHEKGAFTGAIGRKRGRFELANTGTIFLDEIGEINQAVQVKILRVLQEKAFERVGSEDTLQVNVRVVSATNRDLRRRIDEGAFREDLFYRLNVVHIEVPPLRERREDVPLLATAFVKEFARENGKQIEGIDARAHAALYNDSWPGNVRELRNSIESAVVMAGGSTIELAHLPPTISQAVDEPGCIRITTGSKLSDAEREIIRATLAANNGNKTRTAEVLGIGRKTLHRKVAEYGLD